MIPRGRRATRAPEDMANIAGPPSSMEEFLFDLKGYTVVQRALGADELRALNGWVDAHEQTIRTVMRTDPVDYMPAPPSLPLDGMQVQSYHNGKRNKHIGHADDGINLQFPYEAGGVFETLIDHRGWFGRVQHYLGRGTQPYLHELFINLRGQGLPVCRCWHMPPTPPPPPRPLPPHIQEALCQHIHSAAAMAQAGWVHWLPRRRTSVHAGRRAAAVAVGRGGPAERGHLARPALRAGNPPRPPGRVGGAVPECYRGAGRHRAGGWCHGLCPVEP